MCEFCPVVGPCTMPGCDNSGATAMPPTVHAQEIADLAMQLALKWKAEGRTREDLLAEFGEMLGVPTVHVEG